MRALTEKRWGSTVSAVVLAVAVSTAVAQIETVEGLDQAPSVAPPPGVEQETGWPGLPPDCWTEPRLYHGSESKYDWRSWTTIERVQAPPPDDKTLSPNGAYYYAISSEAPSTSILIFAEKEHLVRISFTNLRGLTDVKWINEKLLYLRVWWGRIAATDLVFDVEQERMVLAESVTDGGIAMQQAQESCPLLGGCQCIPKQQ